MIAHCSNCDFRVPAPLSPLRCPTCDNPLDFIELPAFSSDAIAPHRPGMWRYGAWLELPTQYDANDPVTLGEGWTPLIEDRWQGVDLRWKMESQMPTGSYKDRGVSYMVNWLAGLGAGTLVDDSSGNAGASIACYAARAGLDATIYVPSSAPDPKKAQVAIYGGELVEVPGPRSQCAVAAENATRGSREIAYASHAWHPAFVVGMMTLAWEIWEQAGRQTPDWVAVPVGNGGLLQGVWRGFVHLRESGMISTLPRLLAVQAEPYTPLVSAFDSDQPLGEGLMLQETIRADGIAISNPVRGAAALQAVRDSRGLVVGVNDAEIARAHSQLAHQGIFVEPTSATVAAAIAKYTDELAHPKGNSTQIVGVLTGHGLKRPPSLAREE